MTIGPEGLNPTQIAQILNGEFQNGVEAYEVIPFIRALPRPICVDLNNVLLNNSQPLTVNPEAHQALDTLRSVGNVCIVTTWDAWHDAHDALQAFHLWHEDIILMTYYTWQFIHELHNAQKDALVDDYIRFMSTLEIDLSPKDFLGASKYMAPLFKKPFPVPIIDDLMMVTSHNPGMLGICVKIFEPNDKLIERDNINPVRVSLRDAADIVRDHYSHL